MTDKSNVMATFPTAGFTDQELDEILSNGIYYVPDFRDGLRNLAGFFENTPLDSPFLPYFMDGKSPERLDPRTAPPGSAEELPPAQRNAIEKALSQDITFIWGPPGTGKTRTLATLAGILYGQGKRVLVTALSAAAVNEIFLKAVEMQSFNPDADPLDFVRLGKKDNAPPGMIKNFTRTFFPPEGRTITAATSFQVSSRLASAPAPSNNSRKNPGMVRSFDYVIMDEVSMTPIPNLAATSYCARSAVVLAGDSCQLPPPYPENAAFPNELFARNIFEKLEIGIENDPRGVFLDTQYRMARQVSDLVSELFYQGRLKCGNSEPPLYYQAPGSDSRAPLPGLVFIDSSGSVGSPGDFADQDYRRNETHAAAIAGLATKLVAGGVAGPSEIGIIAPYNAQVVTIRKHLDAALREEIKLGTVHSFQGQERKVIIFDVTDDNVDPSPLTSNPKLLNVALSRSRQLLCIVGNKEYLLGNKFDKHMQEIYRQVIERGETWKRNRPSGEKPLVEVLNLNYQQGRNDSFDQPVSKNTTDQNPPGSASHPIKRTATNSADQIAVFFESFKGKACDDCVATKTDVTSRQQVNQIVRKLAAKGLLEREKASCDICRRIKKSCRFSGSASVKSKLRVRAIKNEPEKPGRKWPGKPPLIKELELTRSGRDFIQKWPGGNVENYETEEEFSFLADNMKHTARICRGKRPTYGRDRSRVIVFIDKQLQAEFFGEDNYETSRCLLSEIKTFQNNGLKNINCFSEPAPPAYQEFDLARLPERVTGKGVRNAWAVTIKEHDHEKLIKFSLLRKIERRKRESLLSDKKSNQPKTEKQLNQNVNEMIILISKNPANFLDSMRREIIKWLNKHTITHGIPFAEKIAKISKTEHLPQNTANLIYFVSKFRNLTVYESYLPSKAEILMLASACDEIRNFIKSSHLP